MSNRRNYERHLIRKFALLKLSNGDIFEGETRDLSAGGAFIECSPVLDLAEGIKCAIRLFLEEEDDGLITEIYGSISHYDDEGLGCRFLKVNSVYYQFLEEESD